MKETEEEEREGKTLKRQSGKKPTFPLILIPQPVNVSFYPSKIQWLEDKLLQNAKLAWVGVECEDLLATPGHSASSQRFHLTLSK